MMIDHLTLTVRNLASASDFYAKALAPLGYSKQRDYGVVQGFGPEGKPAFWLKQGDAPQSVMHLAFRSRDRSSVDGFHAAALAAGATDEGAPGLREHYHPHYYGAFIVDPDGHHIEAVCHVPLGSTEGTVSARPSAAAVPKKKAPPKKKAAAKARRKKR